MSRDLTVDEVIEFRTWARENYIPLSPVPSIWHDVVRDECRRMNAETAAGTYVARVKTDE